MLRSTSCSTETLEDEDLLASREFSDFDDSLQTAARERLRVSPSDDPFDVPEIDADDRPRPLPRSASIRRGSLIIIEEDDSRVRVAASNPYRSSVRPASTRTLSRESSSTERGDDRGTRLRSFCQIRMDDFSGAQ
eukprot:TRINITY_DN5796_c0_g1_i2.p1 TRINITY_DN5796_c0_g1~~TRINITY_DN5796_c0_g1_i2.p1  ORF type:complete len:135 (-),score=14.51 TRINITY_DN5796_c0_g1_i2:158-562(-)